MPIRYVFSLNTGRSGSDYLTELFACARNAVSLHEGLPIMNGAPMQAFNAGGEAALRALMPLKVHEIERKRSRRRPVYCETNHSFVKGWGWLLPDAYIPQDEIAVIDLRRDPEQIAHSLLRTHNVPGATGWSRTWWLVPGAPANRSQPPADADPMTLCRWYVDETALRAAEYRRRFPRIRYFDCTLEQLNDPAFVHALFAALGLEPAAGLAGACGRRFNPMNEWPRLPLVDLLAVPPLPSADTLGRAAGERLLERIAGHVASTHCESLARLLRELPFGVPLAPALAGFIVGIEHELEAQFGCRLRHTEFESALVFRLLQRLAPYDLMWLFVRPSTSGPDYYSYDFNRVPNLRTLVGRFGLGVLPRLLRLAARGHSMADDRSHQAAH